MVACRQNKRVFSLAISRAPAFQAGAFFALDLFSRQRFSVLGCEKANPAMIGVTSDGANRHGSLSYGALQTYANMVVYCEQSTTHVIRPSMG